MERQKEIQNILEPLLCPAFLVKDETVIQANRQALDRQIQVGDSIKSLISIGLQEYTSLESGRLCLTITANKVKFNATVVKTDAFDIFYLEPEFDTPELKAFSLAAQHLREPLATALNCTDQLLPTNQKLPSELAEQVAKINRSLYQMHRTLCNMSDVAQYHKLYLNADLRNISTFVDEIVAKAAELASASGLRLEFKGLSQPVWGHIDCEKLERSIYNLISNAIKFSPKDSIITTALYQKDDRIYFSVENDTVSKVIDLYPDIYTRYMREPRLDTEGNGIGIGLTIVRTTAIAHGGTLLLQKIADNRIRFTISLAVKQGQGNILRSPIKLPFDYTGGYDHALVELSDSLSCDLYK